MKFDWIENRLNSKNLETLKELPIFGKNILITPEGYGKSTSILNYYNDNLDRGKIIFSSHTINNACEKYEFMKDKIKNLFYIESDS
jgi:hypothetical protein